MIARRPAKLVILCAMLGSLLLGGCGDSPGNDGACAEKIARLEAQVVRLEKQLADLQWTPEPAPEQPASLLPEMIRREQEKAETIVNLGSFTVSLNDSAGQRHLLQVEITLEAWDTKQAALLESQRDRLRDMINLVLAARPFERLQTLRQRIELKEEIKINVDRTVGSHAVRDVLFGSYFLN